MEKVIIFLIIIGVIGAIEKDHPMVLVFAILIAAAVFVGLVAMKNTKDQTARIQSKRTVKSGTLVLRPDGSVLEPGEDYYDPSLKVIDVGPPDFGRVTFRDAKNNEVSRLIHWTPNPRQATLYANFFHRGDPATAKTRLLAELSDVFAVHREGVDTSYLQSHVQDRYGVTMRVEVPPSQPQPPAPAKDPRSKAEIELDRLFQGVKTAAQARQKWIEMTKNQDFAEALADDDLGPKLEGKYQDIVTRIAEGEV